MFPRSVECPNALRTLNRECTVFAEYIEKEVLKEEKHEGTKRRTFSNVHSISCSTCNLLFDTLKEQREHYKSNVHTESLLFKEESESEEEQVFESPMITLKIKDSLFHAYKCLFTGQSDPSSHKFYFLSLINGGEMSSAIFDLSTFHPIKHKVIKRYVSRKSQGGSQLKNDNKKNSKANSAGAMIRRHNLVMFEQDIKDLQVEWSEALSKCTRFFLNRNSRNDSLIFSAGIVNRDSQSFLKIPFTTYRPSFEEICRVFTELVSLKKIS